MSASGKEMEYIRAARTEAMRGKPHTRRFKNWLYVAHSNRCGKACRRAAKKSKKFYNFYYKPPKAIKFCYNKAKYSMMIKCLLKRHRYPPEGMDDAVQTVMTQCELWTDNNDMESA